MPDTGAPWNIPYVENADLVRDWPADSLLVANAVAAGLDAANTGIGSNVVSATKTDTFSTTSATFTDITGLTVTITPSTDTSKVLLVASVPMGNAATAVGDNSYLQFSGGNTSTYVGDADGNRVRAAASWFSTEAGANNQPRILGNTLLFLDSPASGSPVTYTVQVRVSTGTAFINRNGFDTNSASYPRTAATLVAIEVAP